ncbi:MAG: hypothetical protein R3B46_07790 [Phycisphaerales bacterium]
MAGGARLWCDLPWTEAKLPRFRRSVENWAVIAAGGIPNKTQVGDMGIDGRIPGVRRLRSEKGRKGHTDTFDQFMDAWYPVQVKQRDKAGRRTSMRSRR